MSHARHIEITHQGLKSLIQSISAALRLCALYADTTSNEDIDSKKPCPYIVLLDPTNKSFRGNGARSSKPRNKRKNQMSLYPPFWKTESIGQDPLVQYHWAWEGVKQASRSVVFHFSCLDNQSRNAWLKVTQTYVLSSDVHLTLSGRFFDSYICTSIYY
jgi:hypothetical protein